MTLQRCLNFNKRMRNSSRLNRRVMLIKVLIISCHSELLYLFLFMQFLMVEQAPSFSPYPKSIVTIFIILKFLWVILFTNKHHNLKAILQQLNLKIKDKSKNLSKDHSQMIIWILSIKLTNKRKKLPKVPGQDFPLEEALELLSYLLLTLLYKAGNLLVWICQCKEAWIFKIFSWKTQWLIIRAHSRWNLEEIITYQEMVRSNQNNSNLSNNKIIKNPLIILRSKALFLSFRTKIVLQLRHLPWVISQIVEGLVWPHL